MIRELLNHYHIRFQRDHRMAVLFELVYNLFLENKWKIKKRIQGIRHPIVHVYAVCWNEEKIIPFFLSHYNEFVDHYYIYDNYSDDKTDELLSKQSNISVIKYNTGGTFNDLVHQEIKNTVWKKSRGKADWVIVVDMDEFLYHDDIKKFLSNNLYKSSIFYTEGFDMVTESFPPLGRKITDTIKKGVANKWLNKKILFDPHRIVEINYEVGAHEADPEGIIVFDKPVLLKLLHYKYLGHDYVLDRIYEYRKRLSKTNLENNYGIHYVEEEIEIIAKINYYIKIVENVLG